jgi:hypothetical protein
VLQASLPLTQTASDATAAAFNARARTRNIDLKFVQVQAAENAPPVKVGPAPSWRPQGVAEAPTESAFSHAARWTVTVPPGAMDDLSELFLNVDYRGDVAHLSAGQKLLTDDFYNGHPWRAGLGRFLHQQAASTFELSILPLRKDAPIYFEIPKPISFPPNGQVDRLDGLNLVPEYQLVLSFPATK